jgi:pheromone shutdown protein TraB
MKLDPSYVLVDADGEPIMQPKVGANGQPIGEPIPFTVRRAIYQLAAIGDSQMTPEVKLVLYAAQKAAAWDTMEMKLEDAVVLKAQILRYFVPSIAGQLVELIEG